MAVWSMTVKHSIKGKCVLAMSGLLGGAWGSVFGLSPIVFILFFGVFLPSSCERYGIGRSIFKTNQVS